MRWTKIIGSHLIIWFFVSGIIGVLLGPDVSDQGLSIENIAEQIPSSVLFISVAYLLMGWIIPYKYFNKKP